MRESDRKLYLASVTDRYVRGDLSRRKFLRAASKLGPELSGHVRWCAPSSYNGLYDAGIELDDASTEELAEWAALWSEAPP